MGILSPDFRYPILDMKALNKVFDFTLGKDDILKLNPDAVVDDIFEFMKELG